MFGFLEMTTAHDSSLIYSGVYDPWLVGLSVLTAILASYGALRVSQGIQSAVEPMARLGLLAVGAVALGGGIWAMHFIGMLAFSLPCGVHYDLETTLLSIVPGVLAGGVALMVISRRQATRGTIVFGAILLGAGIGAMHYTGMAAMRLGAVLRYDPLLFAVSIVVAVLLALLALTMKFRARPRFTDASVLPDLLTAAVMGAAISGMHYTAMAAAYFVHDGASALPVSGLDPTILALVIVVVSALLIGVSMLGAVATRTRSLALSLVAANESLGRISRTFENTLNSAGDGIFGLDRDGRVTFVNPAAVDMLGWSRDELIGADAHTMFHHTRPDGSHHQVADCPVTAVLRDGHIHHSLNDVYWRRDGSSFNIEVTVAPVVADGEISGAVVIFRDESQRQRNEYERLLASRVVESSQDGIAISDHRHIILSVNQALLDVFGYQREELVGRKIARLISEPLSRAQIRQILTTIKTQGSWDGEIVAVRKTTEIFPAWVKLSGYRSESGKTLNYILNLSDMTEKKAALERIDYLSRYDPLTSLPNQKMMEDYFRVACEAANRAETGMALICCNIDNFKLINDTLGRLEGDQLLKQVAKRLRGCIAIGTGDIVSRSVGDEFLILLIDVPVREAIDASIYAIRAILSVPFELDNYPVVLTASFGVSRYPEDGTSFDLLFQQADAAVFHAKQAGRNAVRFFLPSMIDYANERLLLKHDLAYAIDRDELVVHYQPLIDLESGGIVGAEALIRWQSPKYGFLMPGRFITIAEETGLIVPIGLWVLREVCRQGKLLYEGGCPPLRFAVNISAIQLRSESFVAKVKRIIEESGLPPGWIELELTESVLISEVDRTLEVVQELKDLGLRLAIDDFGTGYSSLSYLRKLRTDKLKIDRSFVADVTTNPESDTIITTIIQMAQSMNMTTLAEGVETEAQAAFLKSRGCLECQGYYFGRPTSIGEFRKLIGR